MQNMSKLFSLLLLVVLLFYSQSMMAVNIYVSSSTGSDNNDGLTEKTPLKTIDAAYRKGGTNTVLLKAGDVFYIESIVVIGRTLGKYGEGHNPTLCGYKRIIVPNWEKVGNNLWRISLVQNNYTGVQINGSSYSNNIGCIHEYNNDVIHGRKFQYLKDLKQNWDIWQTEMTGNATPATAYDSLYLYYTDNPNDLKLEFSTGQIAVTLRYGTLENVNVVGYGFGISAGSEAKMRGCHIDAIGGRTLISSNSFVCDGNGVGIWIYSDKDTENTIVEDCYISRVYDSGVCLSGSDGYSTTAKNIVVKNNLIAYCCQGWEDFLDKNVKSEGTRFNFIASILLFSFVFTVPFPALYQNYQFTPYTACNSPLLLLPPNRMVTVLPDFER